VFIRKKRAQVLVAVLVPVGTLKNIFYKLLRVFCPFMHLTKNVLPGSASPNIVAILGYKFICIK
jgi:hypothetical protein